MEILWLEVADPPELWRELGFRVGESPGGGSSCVVNGVEHRLVGRTGTRRGVIGWGVRGVDGDIVSIDGITTTVVNEAEPAPSSDHPNGVFRIDHLVVRTSNTPRTASALESIGLKIRGGRTTNSAGTSVDMRFAWAGDTLLELAGPPSPEVEAKPSRLAGIAYATNDLDATAAFLGDRSTTPVDAVQQGRRIAAVRSEVGSTVPIAFMTPHVKA